MTTNNEAWNLDATKPNKPFPHPALECHPDGISEEVNTGAVTYLTEEQRQEYFRLQLQALQFTGGIYREQRSEEIYGEISKLLHWGEK
jgi:hypothetical protein